MRTIIRLQRRGPKNLPEWRIVVQGHYTKLNGKCIDHIGYWFPKRINYHDRAIILNKYRARYWLSCGAVVSRKVQLFLSYYGMMPSPWIPFGRKTLYEEKHEKQREILVGANNYFEKTTLSLQERKNTMALREANEESLYFRKLKLKDSLPNYLKLEVSDENVQLVLREDKSDDDIVERSEKYHFLLRAYEEAEAALSHSSPIKRELVHQKMAELLERGVLEPHELKQAREGRLRSGPSVEAAMRARLALRRDQATANYKALMDMTNSIPKGTFLAALTDRGFEPSKARSITDEIYASYAKTGNTPTYLDLEKLFIDTEAEDTVTLPELRETQVDYHEEFSGLIPRETPTTPPPDFLEYDPNDWNDFREDDSSSIRPVHKRGEKWFDTPLHDAKMTRRLEKEMETLTRHFHKPGKEGNTGRGIFEPFNYFAYPYYTTDHFK